MNLVVLMYSSKYMDANGNFDNFQGITWSQYERIEVKPVNSFKELCKGKNIRDKKQNVSPIWKGVKQSLHLIGLNQKSFELTNGNSGENVFNVKNKNYNFYCILSMRFDPKIYKIKNKENYFDHIKKIKEEVVEIIDKNIPNDTIYSPFRSLGAEDMVIIFLSDSIKDIMNIVNISRNIKLKYNGEEIDLFSTTYMFTGLNNINCTDEIGVPIIVNLHLKHHNVNTLKNEINIKLGKDLAGKVEYKEIFRGKGTLQLEIPGCVKADVLFKYKDGIFNESSDFHKKIFYNSRVYFKEEFNLDYYCTPIDIGDGWSERNKNKKLSKVDDISDVAKFVIGEYDRLIADDRFCQWKDILIEQRCTAVEFVKEYKCECDRLTECHLLEYMQASLHLINQACSPVSDIPYHNYYYSGSFSDLLKAYYGIINMLFKIVYDLPHNKSTVQHKITYAICIEPIANIQSTMYIKESESDKGNDRIIVFSIPYNSFWNYANNIKFLSHEVFHYAAPYDRNHRSKNIADIIFKLILINFLQNVSEEYSNGASQIISDEARSWINYMINEYKNDDEIKEELYDAIKNNCSIFFTLSAPEWSNTFCDDKLLDRVTRLASTTVKKFIYKHKNDVKNHIIKEFNDFRLENALANYIDVDYIFYNKIIKTISTINNAVKEAFCDIWAIKITKTNVMDYIIWLINYMLSIKPYSVVINSMNNVPGSPIKINSFVLRVYLLLYYDYVENDYTSFNPRKWLREALNNIDDNNTKNIFRSLLSNFEKNDLRVSFLNNELYNMAFYNLINYFSNECFTEKFEVKTLSEVYTKDLSEDINEESLNKLVYYDYNPKNDSNHTNNNIINVCTKEFDKKYLSAKFDYCYTKNNAPYIIKSLADYVECINAIYRQNESRLENHTLWYRGICNITYSMLPSLFRYCDDNLSLYANQSNIIKQAYFNSVSSTEIWEQPIQQKMAYLQHYGVPTNLLDFSLDQFVALYFAVNPDKADDRKELDNGNMQPVVYVFNPVGYSEAINVLRSNNPQKIRKYKLSPVLFDIDQNVKECNDFFVSDMSFDYLVNHTEKFNVDDYIPSPCSFDYPMPIVIEHTNQRIKAQSGTFVAYPLDAKPQSEKTGEDRYHYMDLKTIQNNYTDLINKKQVDGPFLYTIEIYKASISLIRQELEQFRINSGKYYPELSKIFENMKNK